MGPNNQRIYKVLITGVRSTKCMAVANMIPWASHGFKEIMAPNLKATILQKIQPDILIVASRFVWYDLQDCLAEFLKYGTQKQIIAFDSAYDRNTFGNYPEIQVLKEEAMQPSDLMEALSQAVAVLNSTKDHEDGIDESLPDDVRLKKYLLQVPSPRIMLLRIELEKQNENYHSRILSRIESFLHQNNDGFVFREKSGKYCAGLFMETILMTEQLNNISKSISELRRNLCSLTKGRVCIFTSSAVNIEYALREYEKAKTLDQYRFFCADWPTISEAALMQDRDMKECNWVEIKECQTELMEASICGDKDRISRVLSTLFRDHVRRSRGIHFYQMIMAQLEAIWACLYCITQQGNIQPKVETVHFWCVEDAMDNQIKRFHAVALEHSSEKAINPLVIKVLMMLIRNQDRSLYVGTLADQLGVSEYYLSRIFKQTMGIGIVECSRYMIIYAAALDMLQGERKIADLADKYGFSDAKYFSKVFRQILNQTPTEWVRRNCREDLDT